MDFEKPKTVGGWIILLAAAGLICTSPYGAGALIKEIKRHISAKDADRKKEIASRTITQALYHLKKRKLIKINKTDGTTEIVLTESGKKRKLAYDLDNISIAKPKSWDKKWRMIMFDIPESKKRKREEMREKFKRLGMMQFQKSVWIYPYECENEVDFIAETLGVRDYIHFMSVAIDNDSPLKANFHLS